MLRSDPLEKVCRLVTRTSHQLVLTLCPADTYKKEHSSHLVNQPRSQSPLNPQTPTKHPRFQPQHRPTLPKARMHLTNVLIPLLLTSLPCMLANPVASPNGDAVLGKGDLLGQLCGSSINATMAWEDMTTNCGGNKNELVVCIISIDT